ncbi:sensor histidine kinase [Actinomadura atramentaria]|uniref:sensor histidine kinase n=1 Tax=Actinomadura atramentaria TaxID=1990 RepID=UPI00036BA276|nr:histidine kinase [Actinomadura atramentaria]
MKQFVSGFARSAAAAGVALLIPAVWAAFAALGIWWAGSNPWVWIPPVLWACISTVLLARLVCRMTRGLVARWTGTEIPDGYWKPAPLVQLSTGYWWNGFTYTKNRRQSLQEQELRVRWFDPANWRDLRFVLVAPVAGLVAAIPVLGLAALVLPTGVGRVAGVAVLASPYTWRPFVAVARRFLRPSRAMALAERVDELTAQRADMTVVQAAELRRIERDLHDGAQARLVSLGLSLATAEKLLETDPGRARALLAAARGDAAASIGELRELVQGISPPVLGERGLVDAVRLLALDSPLDVAVRADELPRPEAPVDAAVYFAVAEILTNAVKHARASRATVALAGDGAEIAVVVEDDGRGGAVERPGGGLDGLRRRLAVFDGTLEIDSPAGGPTRVRIAVPCVSS